MPKEVVLSGMRPTGRLHVGHIEGVLREWIKLQEMYDSFYFVADWHAITTKPDTRGIVENTYEMVRDWLAFGIDPNKSTLFIQSQVPEHSELHLTFSMLNTLARLERLPTFREYVDENVHVYDSGDSTAKNILKRDKVNYGFLGYPILQAADILMYKTNYVPVGEDQLPHIELAREIARKFNGQYGEIFPIPQEILSNTPRILGTDGQKMGKSVGNCINPTDDKETLTKKINTMITDKNRIKKTDPGNPMVCSIYDLHHVYNENQEIEIGQKCRYGEIGCTDCKAILPPIMAETYKEFREKRNTISDDMLSEILREGTKKARAIAQKTIKEVKEVMLLNYF